MSVALAVAALVLGIIGRSQKQRNRRFAALGTYFSEGAIVWALCLFAVAVFFTSG